MPRSLLPAALALIVFAAGCGSPRPAGAQSQAGRPEAVASAADLVRAARARYGDTWYRTLTFTQATRFYSPDGEVAREETWHEAARIPGALRIDLPVLGAGNVYLFRGDSTYVFRDGEQVAAQGEGNPLMLLGFELYRRPVAETMAGLAALGIDTTAFRADTWEGRPAWVVGAAPGDSTSPQVWFDRERLVFLRLVERAGPDGSRVQDIRFEDYEPLGGGWIAPRVEVYADGRLVMTEDYADVVADPPLPPGTFSPTGAPAVRWWE